MSRRKIMVKFILGIVFGILALIFIFQNMQMVDVTFLAWTITTSRALMLLIILIVGFILGWAVGGIGRRRRASEKEKRNN
jgi:uncharacterized integral membrane protein